MNDFVKRLQSARNWFNGGQCCGQVDSARICCAPACIFGEALKEFSQAAARIAELEAALGFYADENSWRQTISLGDPQIDGVVSRAEQDRGRRACATLEGKGNE